MPEPCEQKETIDDIWEAVDEIKTGQKEGLSELRKEVKELVHEFREVTKEMRDLLVDGRELKTRLGTSERDIDILFKEQRLIKQEMSVCQVGLKQDIGALQTWVTKEEGARGLLRSVPVICTIITFLIFLYFVVRGSTGSLPPTP